MSELNKKLTSAGYESAMHLMCDALCEQFETLEAENYIEQVFADKTDKSKSYVVTMQKVSGVTPCQKLAAKDEENKKLREFVQMVAGLDVETFVFDCLDGGYDFIEYVDPEIVSDANEFLSKLQGGINE